MTRYLDLPLLLRVAERAIGSSPMVRDYGLLESAAARPQTTVFGKDAYPTLVEKAAALLHSLSSNHALVDGNKRLAWHATVVFCFINGLKIEAPDDDAYELMIAVADGSIEDTGKIAEQLLAWASEI